MLVLVLNVGSSSLKAAVFDSGAEREQQVFAATLTTRYAQPVAAVRTGTGGPSHEERIGDLGPDGAIGWLLARLDQTKLGDRVTAVGHRLVHGGARFKGPVWLEPSALADLRKLVDLAPDHLPAELAVIDTVARRWPHVRQAGCFDTAFHCDLPVRSRLFGIPRDLTDAGIVRYGFHGLSYEYVVHTLRAAGALGRRLVVAHLGSGSSLAAIRDGKSIDTTMGFTPAGGVVMATRSGDIDPGVLLHLLRTRRLNADDLNRIVNVDGGLAGISGVTGDMQTLLDRSTAAPHAAEAIDIFCYQVRKAIAAGAAALGGIDSLVFTAGIGEHAATVRSRICETLGWCGVTLDAEQNAANAPIISPLGAPVMVRVIPANEELMIARHVLALLRPQPPTAPR